MLDGRTVAAWLLVGATTLAAAELMVRVVNPTPRVQIVRDEARQRLVEKHGDLTWTDPGTGDRRREDCGDDGVTDVVMVGSSITYGVGVTDRETMSARLQEALDAREPGQWCVHNLAQPAYVGGSKLAELKDALPRLRPEIVVWEIWGQDAGRYQRVGREAYNLWTYRLGPDGLPWVLPLPTPVHRALFERSRLYAYGTLALSPLDPRGPSARWDRFRDEILPELDALLAAHPTRMLTWVAVSMDRPFADQVQHQPELLSGWKPWLDARGVPVVPLYEALTGTPPEAVGMDTCCHFNVAGHARVAEILLPHVLARRDAPVTTPPDGALDARR